MVNYLLENVTLFEPEKHLGKTILIVHKIHRTPYHLGLLYNKMYHSLTVNGPEVKTEEEIFSLLTDSTYNNLMIEVKGIEHTMDCAGFFAGEGLNENQFRSCLYPIREFLAAVTSNNSFNETNNLFDLLDELQRSKLVAGLSATRMTAVMEGKIVLERYTQDTIQKHLKRLKELNQREKDNTNHKI